MGFVDLLRPAWWGAGLDPGSAAPSARQGTLGDPAVLCSECWRSLQAAGRARTSWGSFQCSLNFSWSCSPANFWGFFVPLTHFSSWVCPSWVYQSVQLCLFEEIPSWKVFPATLSSFQVLWAQKALDLGKQLELLERSSREKQLGSQQSQLCPTWHSTSRESAAPTPGRGTRTSIISFWQLGESPQFVFSEE